MAVIDEFCEDAVIRGLAAETIRGYRNRLELFQAGLGKKKLQKAGQADLVSHIKDLREKGLTTKSIAFHLTALSCFYDYLVFQNTIKSNPVTPIRKRYLSAYKTDGEKHTHKLVSVEEAARLIDSMVDIRDKAMMLLLFKTGIRRNELVSLDIDCIHWEDQSILLKPAKKRSNRTVFYDNEAAYYLRRWLSVREERALDSEKALFVNNRGVRLKQDGVEAVIVKAAIRIGLHDRNSSRMEDHFSPHCARHFFTTYLSRSGMRREYIQFLRGDAIKEAIDIYFHINPEDVRREYLAHIPQLGV